MKKKATIIIPTHQIEKNRRGNIISLMNQLREVVDPNEYRTVIVCNNDRIARQLGSDGADMNYDRIRNEIIVNLRANFGLSYAWNRGLRYVEDDYVFFVNHDLIITRDENPFEKMIKEKEDYELRSGRKVFAFGVEGTRQTLNPTPKMIQRLQVGQFDETIEVDEVSGFLFGISNSLLSPSFFDENLSPCFYEEMDLCQRVRSQNRQLAFLGMEPMVNIIIPDIGYRHDFGVSAANPHETLLLWLNAKDGKTYREDLWTINRRNHDYVERKWNISLD